MAHSGRTTAGITVCRIGARPRKRAEQAIWEQQAYLMVLPEVLRPMMTPSQIVARSLSSMTISAAILAMSVAAAHASLVV